jgi:uncharacterized protein (UPF0276 family)
MPRRRRPSPDAASLTESLKGTGGVGRISQDRPPEAPYLGVGVGLRPTHYPEVFRRLEAAEAGPAPPDFGVDWFELLSENYMIRGGRPLRVARRLSKHIPLALHGVSLNIGSSDPLDGAYLEDLARLAELSQARWISDHLCWTGVGGHNTHDLVPLPYTAETVDHVAERVRAVQARLGRRIALENVSSYLSYCADALPEWEFLAAIARQADCGILLDVNNIFVSAHNHGFDASEYIEGIPAERVFQIHLAGHSQSGPLLIDTHDHPVRSEVWELYEQALVRTGPVSTLIEWDDHIPPFSGLLAEVARARDVLEKTWPGAVADGTAAAATAIATGAVGAAGSESRNAGEGAA